ncbi:PEP-CTERM sorting domain-containing protein [Duganella sp. FT80W]|uniref:PEP-CTERM sorting domain-containing protein n=1 Tax=Duganella guangzhouensis TaxID=2666084 RepID=A0A6I2KVL2_9BURK|nr:NF038129 family PEP-CTERM protein [Duganella guangzhouensis]MRW89751.1 PEP-CTERM sorting domain-containing protein [Duganella guangzhouensis]
MNSPFKRLLAGALIALAALGAGSGSAAAGTLHIAIDTSSFGATSGYLDMQLSATAGMPLATALVSNMTGFDSSAFIDSWGVTTVAGGYLFRNDTANDLFHAVSYGGVMSFDLTFSGAVDPLTAYISHFVISAYGADGVTALGNPDPVTGALANFSWTPATSAGTNGIIGIQITDARVAVVPEPAAWQLLAAGMLLMAMVRRRQR